MSPERFDLDTMHFPAIVRAEAHSAMRRIYYKFGGPAGKGGKALLMESPVARLWISNTGGQGTDCGWGRLIKDTAAAIMRAGHPNFAPADAVCADHKRRVRAIRYLQDQQDLEHEIIEHAASMGWFHGALRPKPKVRTIEMQRKEVSARLGRWRSKAKRAATAIKKLERTMRRLDRLEGEARIEQEAKLL